MTSRVTRRQTLALVGGAVPGVALAQGTVHRPNLGERSLGSSSAKTTVVEYHSFTCHVCQKFKLDVYPEFKAKFLTNLGFEPVTETPEQFANFLKGDRELAAQKVKVSGAKLD